MDCEELRAQWLEDPANLSADAREHLGRCIKCEEFDRIGRQREAMLNQAFALPQPEGYTASVVAATAPDRVVRKPRSAYVRWVPMAMAASLAAVVGVQYSGLLGGSPSHSIASAAVEHAGHKIPAVASDNSTIDGVLAKMGMAWQGAREALAFAEICPLSGMHVAHLVVHDTAGDVAVMVLPEAEHAAVPSMHEGKCMQAVAVGNRQAILVADSEVAIKAVAEKLQSQLVGGTA